MKVRYTPRARRDLQDIYSYIEPRNAGAARSVEAVIRHTAETLAEFPYIGVQTDRAPQFRGIKAGRYPYRIYYRIEDDEIWIVHIRHMARQPWEGGE
jgi:addiction module RelE/StbE family toxin